LEKIVEELAELDEEMPSATSLIAKQQEEIKEEQDERESKFYVPSRDSTGVKSEMPVMNTDEIPANNAMPQNEVLTKKEIALRELYQTGLQKSPILAEKMAKSTAATSGSSVPLEPPEQHASELVAHNALLSAAAAAAPTVTFSGISAVGSKLYGPAEPNFDELNRIIDNSKTQSSIRTTSQIYDDAVRRAAAQVYTQQDSLNFNIVNQNEGSQTSGVNVENRQKTSEVPGSESDPGRSTLEKQLLAVAGRGANQNLTDRYSGRFEKNKEQLFTINESDWSSASSSKASRGELYREKKPSLDDDDEFDFLVDTGKD